MAGRLVVVATPIGNLGDLSPRAVETLRDADVIAAEDTRRTRALLTHAGIPGRGRLVALHAHNERRALTGVVERVAGGDVVAYVTDAGTPGVSDPGLALVRACVDAGLDVSTVPGPSAVLAALVLSGLDADRFVFEGFLPRKGRARAERLAEIAAETRTVVCFEAPGRVAATLRDLADVCGPDRPVAVARELTKLHEEVWRGPVADAAERAARDEPRGEHVCVFGVRPRDDDDVVDDDTLDATLRAAFDEGLSTRDAAARVATQLAVPKRRAYARATALREERK